MATRKQRARRAKTFRHEYGFVEQDEEGNVVELSGAELRAKKGGDRPAAKAGGAPAKAGAKSGPSGSRSAREPQPPSWDRAIKRGLLMGLVAGVFLVYVAHGSIAVAAIYAVAFVPLVYWTDGWAYRRYQQKKTGGSSARSGKTR